MNYRAVSLNTVTVLWYIVFFLSPPHTLPEQHFQHVTNAAFPVHSLSRYTSYLSSDKKLHELCSLQYFKDVCRQLVHYKTNTLKILSTV